MNKKPFFPWPLQGLFMVVILWLAACSSSPTLTKEERQSKILYGQGTSELMQKEYANAISHLEQANELTPGDSKILNNLAMAYYFKKQTATAIDYLQKSLAADAKNQDARSNLATIYMEQKKFDQALATYHQVLEDVTYPKQHVTHYNIAKLYLAQDKKGAAIQELKLALEEDPDYCQANYTLGQMYAQDHRYQQALDCFKKSASGACIRNIDGHYQQALMQIELRHFTEARSILRAIIEHYTQEERYLSLANEALRKLDRLAPESEVDRIKSRWDKEQNKIWHAQKDATPTEFKTSNF